MVCSHKADAYNVVNELRDLIFMMSSRYKTSSIYYYDDGNLSTGPSRNLSIKQSNNLYQKPSKNEISKLSCNARKNETGWTFPPLWVFYNAPSSLLDVRLRTEQDRLRERGLSSSALSHCFTRCTRAEKSCGIFGAESAPRRLASFVAGHLVYNVFMVLVIILDVIHPAAGEKYHIPQLEYVFMSIYVIEVILKMTAYGVICHNLSYFRVAWNVFDFILLLVMYVILVFPLRSLVQTQLSLILSEYVSSHHNDQEYRTLLNILAAMRAFKAIKIFKTVNSIRGLRTLLSAMYCSVRMLSQVIVLSIFWLVVFALLGLQLFMGAFKRRCVSEYTQNIWSFQTSTSYTTNNLTINDTYITTSRSFSTTSSDLYNIPDHARIINGTALNGADLSAMNNSYVNWIYNESNWDGQVDWDGDYYMCGNSSGARSCGAGYVCLELPLLPNPHDDKLSFDDFGDAFLAAFQLTLLDDWSLVYRKVVEAKGPFASVYFIVMVFFGSFQLLNTILALINIAYTKELLKQANSKKTNTSNLERVFSFRDTRTPDIYVSDAEPEGEAEGEAAGEGDAAYRSDTNRDEPTNHHTVCSSPDDQTSVDNYEDAEPVLSNIPHQAELKQPDDLPDSAGGGPEANINSSNELRAVDMSTVLRLAVMSDSDANSYGLYNLNQSAVSYSEHRGTGCFTDLLAELSKLQDDVAEASEHELFELSMGLLILINVIIMALDHHGSSDYIDELITRANAAFTGVFITEALIKLSSQGRNYFKSRWNIFDLLVVLLGIFDFTLSADSAVTVLRAFKILRVLRLGRVWSTMRSLITAMSNALPVIGNMSVISLIFLLIMALIGMRGLKNYYTGRIDELDMWRFDDYIHSLSVAYIIFCGEFIEPLYSCFDAAEDDLIGRPMCVIIILFIFILGNLMIMNLYVSIILSNFSSEIFDLNQQKDIKSHIKSTMIRKWTRFKTKFAATRATKNTQLQEERNLLLNDAAVDPKYISNILKSQGSLTHSAAGDIYGASYHALNQEHSTFNALHGLNSERKRNLHSLPHRHSSHIDQPVSTKISTNQTRHSWQDINQSTNRWLNINQSAHSEHSPVESSEGHQDRKGRIENKEDKLVSQREKAVEVADIALAQRLLKVVQSENSLRRKHKNMLSDDSPTEYDMGVMSKALLNPGTKTGLDSHAVSAVDMINSAMETVIGKGGGFLTESEKNQKLLEMLVPKTRRKTLFSIRRQQLDEKLSPHKAMNEDRITHSYDDEIATVVCERDILDAQPIIFLKCNKTADSNLINKRLLSAAVPNRVIPSMEFLETEKRRKQKDDIMITVQQELKSSLKQKDQYSPALHSFLSLQTDDKVTSLVVPDIPGLNQQAHKQLSDIDRQLKILSTPTSWSVFKDNVARVVNTWVFELIIILIILFSVVCLALDDIMLIHRPQLSHTLFIMNYIVLMLFTLEMLIRLTAMGLYNYITNLWCLLDCFIIITSIVDTAITQSQWSSVTALGSLKAIRCLRALRPLRVVSRLQGLKLTVNALVYSLPSVFNVLCLICVLLLFCSIVATNLFGGKLYYCHDRQSPPGEILPPSKFPDRNSCISSNNSWVNPFWHFDHVGASYLSLFGALTFDNWLELMVSTSDAWQVDSQPVTESRYYTSILFFTVFSLIGSMFILNLFIGVMIDSFNNMKKQLEGYNYAETLMTETQRHFYHMLRNLGRVRPAAECSLPDNRIRAIIYRVVSCEKFDSAILLLIMVNMITMCFSYYNQPDSHTQILNIIDLIIISLFVLELILKLIAYSYRYFKSAWNLLDFVVLIISLVGFVMEQLGREKFLLLSPTVLRSLRIFRTTRALRVVRRAQGVRKILVAMLMSIPALLNIAALLLLVMTVYSIIGMQLFMYTKPVNRLNQVFNFQTMGGSMMIMFTMMTGDGWTFMLESLSLSPPYCNNTHAHLNNGTYLRVDNGECGSYLSAVFFCVSYILITCQIIVNCYIALILETYEELSQETDLLREDDITSFYKVWMQYDPQASQFITYRQLCDFLNSLEAPLRISKPNKIAISILNINVSTGMKVHCLDVLQRLISHNLSSSQTDEISNIPDNLLSAICTQYQIYFPEYLDVEIMSTTKELALTECAIRKLQTWWRVLQNRRSERGKAEQRVGGSEGLSNIVARYSC